MGLTKNSFRSTNSNNNIAMYTLDSIPGQFRVRSLSDNTLTPGVHEEIQGAKDIVVNIPFDLIQFGRVANFPTSQWLGFWSYDQSPNFSIGLHRDYFGYIPFPLFDDEAYGGGQWLDTEYVKPHPPIIMSGKGRDNFIPIKVGGFKWMPADIKPGQRWSFIEDFKFNSLDANGQRSGPNGATVVCTSTYKELQRELIADPNNGTIHYIALIEYTFRFMGYKCTETASTEGYWPTDRYIVNVLVDFQYSVDQPIGIEILNSNVYLGGTATTWETLYYVRPDAQIQWYLERCFGENRLYSSDPNYIPGVVGSDTVTYKYVGSSSTSTVLASTHQLYYPKPIFQITSFTTMLSSTGISLLYSMNHSFQFYFTYNNTGAPTTVDWRKAKGFEKSYWIPETRGPLRSLKAGYILPSIWGLNPSGSIDATHGWNFPIVCGDLQQSNTIPASTAVLANEDQTCKYLVSYAPGAAINVYATDFPGNIGSSGSAHGNFAGQPRELPIAGVKYTDCNGTIYYTSYILTENYLFMSVMFSHGVSKVYTYNRSIDSRTIDGIYSNGPTSDFIMIKYSKQGENPTDESIQHTKRIDMASFTPNYVALNEQVNDGKAVFYNIQIGFSTIALAQAAYTNMISSYSVWTVRIGHPTEGDLITIDADNSRIEDSFMYLRLEFNSYLMVHPDINKTSVVFYIVGIDNALPYIVSCTDYIDARPLQLKDLQLSLWVDTLSTGYGVLPSGLYSSGVIPLTKNQIQTGKFKVTCSGVTDNILYSKIYSCYNDMNWQVNESANDYKNRTATLYSTYNYGLNTWFPLSILTSATSTRNQFIIQASNTTPSLSSNVVSNNGHNGPKMTIVSKCYESRSVWFPVITCYDDHQFIFGRCSNNGNLIDIDKVSDSNYNRQVMAGYFFVPKPGDTETYRLGFNIRCAPNYLNANRKYVLNYEGEALTDINKRISTPTISRWWLVGIPYRPYTGEGYIYPLGYYGDIPLKLGRGILESVTTERDGRSKISEVNFTGERSFNDSNIGAQGYRTFQEYVDLMAGSYVNNTDKIDKILMHVSGAASGHTQCNIGTVWTSGYNAIPSGYMDFNNMVFTTTFNQTPLINGTIPISNYGVFFIVEDVLGHRTAVDLAHLNASGYAPSLSDFAY